VTTTMGKTFEDFGISVSGHGEVDTTCPECSSVRKKPYDKCLSVNTDGGTWFCHHCGWTGGIGTGGTLQARPKPTHFKKPAFRFQAELPDKVYKFLVEERKIPLTVLQRNRVCADGDVIKFPFSKDGDCVNIKHRTLDKKFWQTPEAEKILYGYDDIDNEVTIITEGEIDKLSFEVGGFRNVVSVPDGAPSPHAKSYASKFDFLESCKDRLGEVKQFILAVDGDAPGKKLEEELVRRLGPEKCSRVIWPQGCKDANDVLLNHGPEGLVELIETIVPWPVKGIISVAEIDLETLYDRGLETGYSPGWYNLERFYTVDRESGELTVVTGIPGHGKSEWMDALMVNLALSDRIKFAVCSPENLPLSYHVSKIAEKHSGVPFREGFQSRMTLSQVKNTKAWMNEYFSFVLPDEEDMSIKGILELARILVYQKGIRGLVIDPWNELDHSRPDGMSETEYISQSLSKVRRFARLYNCHVWLVAHPTKMVKGNNGMYPVPTPYDISGSAHWRNKADNCLAVWRDFSTENFETEIHVQKIRKKHIGRIGMAKLQYEYSTGRYFDVKSKPITSIGVMHLENH